MSRLNKTNECRAIWQCQSTSFHYRKRCHWDPLFDPRNTGVVASQTRLDASHVHLCRRPCRVGFSSSTDLTCLLCRVHCRCHGRWKSSTICGNTFYILEQIFYILRQTFYVLRQTFYNLKSSVIIKSAPFFEKKRERSKVPIVLGKYQINPVPFNKISIMPIL